MHVQTVSGRPLNSLGTRLLSLLVLLLVQLVTLIVHAQQLRVTVLSLWLSLTFGAHAQRGLQYLVCLSLNIWERTAILTTDLPLL